MTYLSSSVREASRFVFTITSEMKRAPIKTLGFNRWFMLRQAIGPILSIDIGKRVYEVTSPSGYTFYQVESDQQMKERLNRVSQ